MSSLAVIFEESDSWKAHLRFAEALAYQYGYIDGQ